MRLILALFALLFPTLAAAKPTEAKPALWKLADKDTTIWLFGSVHVLPPDILWFKGKVAKAFAASEALVVETELGGDAAGKANDAKAVMAHCYGGYTTNLTMEDFLHEGNLLAYKYEEDPLPTEHGGPCRLFVPHLYFWKSAKWVKGLQFTERDEAGFWELRGYHMYGDPFREQRYSGD